MCDAEDDEAWYTKGQVKEDKDELHSIMDQNFSDAKSMLKDCANRKNTQKFLEVWSGVFEN
eukprot:10973980-Karenia_brevis.AAC.1